MEPNKIQLTAIQKRQRWVPEGRPCSQETVLTIDSFSKWSTPDEAPASFRLSPFVANNNEWLTVGAIQSQHLPQIKNQMKSQNSLKRLNIFNWDGLNIWNNQTKHTKQSVLFLLSLFAKNRSWLLPAKLTTAKKVKINKTV